MIEAAAGSVADAVLAQFPRVQSVKVTIHKPHAPIAATFSDVGVTLVACARAMTAALLALGGNVGDSRGHSRPRRGAAVRRQGYPPDRALVRLPHPALGLQIPAAIHQPVHRGRDHAERRASLLARAQAVELQLGRDRAHEKRWGPRTADIDIIAYDDLSSTNWA